jgi:hypothetical protein
MPIPTDILRSSPVSSVLRIVPQDTVVVYADLYPEGSVTPYDLTGCTAKLEVRQAFDSGTALITKTSASLGTNGVISITLTPTETGTLNPPAGNSQTPEVAIGWWDLELNDGTDRKTLVGGPVILVQQVTR